MERQEQKFFLDYNHLSFVLSKYNANVSYPRRIVNSIYFDTDDFNFYYDGEEGVVPRSKIRIRWYGDMHTIPRKIMLEHKQTLANYKIKSSEPYIFTTLKNVSDHISKFYGLNLRPKCQVTYSRIYYENMDSIRFTFDENIKFKNIDSNVFHCCNDSVFEIKFEGENSHYFTSDLGDRMVRYSKYNESIIKLFDR